MPLTILTDSEVRSLLHSLSRDDILSLQHNLAEALHDYSTGTQETSGGCSANQPMRISINSGPGQTTLFMPARTGATTGIKIVSLASVPSPTPSLGSRQSSINSSVSALVSDTSNLSLRPSLASNQSTTPRGCVTILDGAGVPLGFINAEELTAFRTALASTLLFTRRSRVHSITVFGAGKQAYWHIRLALILRGEDIHHVNIINRSYATIEPLLREIYKSDDWVDLRSANDKLKFSAMSAEYGDYARLLKEHVRGADVIFCCTPSTSPLFPAEHLTNSEGRRKGRYISLIGSYKPHMVELHPDILRQAVEPDHKHHHHKHADKGGVVVVDSLEACLKEAGEVIQAGLTAAQLVEIGELVMVKKAVLKEKELGGEGEKGLKRWLDSGNVVYKSVGLGLMDLCVGGDLVTLAQERGIGTTIAEF
jgi:ornithine cyclodeaminase/alanine dehydrogenase-like protein (mu-crystallin family)